MDAEKDNNRRVTTTSSSLSEDMWCKMLCASCIAFLYILCWNVRKKSPKKSYNWVFGKASNGNTPLKQIRKF
jgi:hypothetical protein